MPRYSFKIDPCPQEDGYGWVLRYFEDDWEIPGYEIFAVPHDVEWMKRVEYENAKFSGELWVEEMVEGGVNVVEAQAESEPDPSQLSFKLER